MSPAAALIALSVTAAPALAMDAAVSFSIEPPPGWSQQSSSGDGGQILALKGPEQSSFVLTRIAPVSWENRAAVRGLLTEAVNGVNARERLGYRAAANLETATYGNGLTARFLRADIDGRPRLALAVMELDGVYLLGTLRSAVPDTLLPAILGALKGSGVPAAAVSGAALSRDGELSFRLPAGVRPRPPSEQELKAGCVAVLSGPGAQLLVMKLTDDDTPAQRRAAVVKSTVRAGPGVDPKSAGPVEYLLSSAGPDFIYAVARCADAAGPSLYLAGYMPWGYWGYSFLAKGPQAPEMTRELLSSLSLGPSAVPKLVAASPRLSVRRDLSWVASWSSNLILALLAVVVVWFWWRNRGD